MLDFDFRYYRHHKEWKIDCISLRRGIYTIYFPFLLQSQQEYRGAPRSVFKKIKSYTFLLDNPRKSRLMELHHFWTCI